MALEVEHGRDASLRPVRVAALGILVLVAGSLGPWAQTANRDGLLTLACSALAALGLWRRLRLVVVVAATLALTVVLYDLLALDLHARWGLWLSLGGGLTLATGATIVRPARRRRR